VLTTTKTTNEARQKKNEDKLENRDLFFFLWGADAEISFRK